MIKADETAVEIKNSIVGALERILTLANKMTVTTSANRQILFQLTKSPIESLLEINREHFGNSEAVRARIAVLAKALLTVRNMGEGHILVDRADGNGTCPHCDSIIQCLPGQPDAAAQPETDTPWIIYCPKCSLFYFAALESLSRDGFGIPV